MEHLRKTKKSRLGADFSLDRTGDWGGCMNQNENDWKFKSYKGSNLGYDMICESVNSHQDKKKGDVLNSNCIMNLKILITNMDKFLVCKECAHERELQIKVEEERRFLSKTK